MKTILVTGGTSGIGLYIADRLVREGFQVFGTSRNPKAAKKKYDFELVALDITSESSIQNCIHELQSRVGHLDVLINNAGIGICGSVEETSMELAEKQFQTNFWGTVKMTKAILPIMRQQRSGRIITIGSLAGLIGVPFQAFYAASKHALEGFMKSLRFEVSSFNIHVSVVQPGFFKTNLHHMFEYAAPCVSDYDHLRDHAMKTFADGIDKAPLPEPVAEAVVKAVIAPKPEYSYRVGTDATWLPRLQFFTPRFYEKGLEHKFSPKRLLG